MCGRYILVSKLKKIEKRFNLKPSAIELPFEANYNISPGSFAPVITSQEPNDLQLFRFGLTPFWAKKPMYLINARAEGNYNKDNDIRYNGQLGIKEKPSFRKPFTSQRCLIPADAFIEGTTVEKLSKPFVVYPVRKEDRPFAFAGLYDYWLDKSSGEIIASFCIITTTPPPILQLLPHHRSPVCLEDSQEEAVWLDKNASTSDLEDLLRRRSGNRFNAYPIDPVIKNPRLNHADLIKPLGERIIKEFDYEIERDIELFGMGMTTSRKRRNQQE
ncbi:MAG: SOS response-associated peptidase [Vicingaceae bacterium]